MICGRFYSFVYLSLFIFLPLFFFYYGKLKAYYLISHCVRVITCHCSGRWHSSKSLLRIGGKSLFSNTDVAFSFSYLFLLCFSPPLNFEEFECDSKWLSSHIVSMKWKKKIKKITDIFTRHPGSTKYTPRLGNSLISC